MRFFRRFSRKLPAFAGCICLLFSFLTGCQDSDISESFSDASESPVPVQEDISEKSYLECEPDMDMEEYLEMLSGIQMDDQTLIYYVPSSQRFQKDAVEQLNQYITSQGYSFQVQIRQYPILTFSNTQEFITALKKEKLPADLIGVHAYEASALVEEGYFEELDVYMDTSEGKKLKESLPECYWDVTRVNKKIWFVGTFDIPYLECWAVNKEIMDEYGFSREDLAKPVEDLEDVLQLVWEGEKDKPEYKVVVNDKEIIDFYPLLIEPDGILSRMPASIPNSVLPIGCWNEELDGADGIPELVNIVESEAFYQLAETLNDYYQKGYVKEAEEGFANTHNFFMQLDWGFPALRSDFLDTWTNENGIVMEKISYYPQTTEMANYSRNGILAESVHKAEAFSFLAFVMSDKEASNLLIYGVEGVDYQKKEDGTVVSDDARWYDYRNASIGNLRLTDPLEPYEDLNKTELFDQTINNLKDSSLAGFYFDRTPVQKQVEAITEINCNVSVYRMLFMFDKEEEENLPEWAQDMHASDWREFYQGFLQKLKEAGIDEVVEEMNQQFKAYHEKNS